MELCSFTRNVLFKKGNCFDYEKKAFAIKRKKWQGPANCIIRSSLYVCISKKKKKNLPSGMSNCNFKYQFLFS